MVRSVVILFYVEAGAQRAERQWRHQAAPRGQGVDEKKPERREPKGNGDRTAGRSAGIPASGKPERREPKGNGDLGFVHHNQLSTVVKPERREPKGNGDEIS